MSVIERNGDFNDGRALSICGSIHTQFSSSVSIRLNTFQLAPLFPTPTCVLQIYKGTEPYKQYTNPASDNIGDMILYSQETLDISKGSEYMADIRCNSKYLTFIINNTTGQNDFYFHLSVHTNDSVVDNSVVRDKIIELDAECMMVRNVGDYKTEIQAEQHKGMTAWSMSAKGDLTNTEYCVYDDAINTLGFFNTTDFSHSAEQIVIKSTSALDTTSGLGARVLDVIGLDAYFNPVREECLMSGTNGVYLSTQMSEINSISVKSSGSLYCNAGTITAYNTNVDGGSTNPQATITMNTGTHHNSQYCVPLGFTLIVHKVNVVSHAEDECELIFNKYNWDIRINKQRLKTFHLHGNSSWECAVSFNIMEKERFTITAAIATAPTGINRVSVNVFGYLKKNDFIIASNQSHNSLPFIEKH